MRKDDVMRYTNKKLADIASRGDAAGRTLAELRRGLGKQPGGDPRLWGLLFSGMDEPMMGKGGEPSHAEWAVHTALTLYALHQQGYSPKTGNMHVQGRGLGKAAAMLCASGIGREAVERRLGMLLAADAMPGAAYHLRGLVQLLRKKGIGLDYARLAADLYEFQFPDGASAVRLRWGREFAAAPED